jgi:hypothetical protein
MKNRCALESLTEKDWISKRQTFVTHFQETHCFVETCMPSSDPTALHISDFDITNLIFVRYLCIRWKQEPNKICQVLPQNVGRLSRIRDTSTVFSSSVIISVLTTNFLGSRTTSLQIKQKFTWRWKRTSLNMNYLARFYPRPFELWVCKLKINESIF